MPLKSTLFSGDAKLEAAAVSDPDHIVPGSVGEHVRKIQLALILLDGAKIAADSMYGPATAAAVLSYKRKRNIVNRSYQTTADNVVGKMTMASLDSEMVSREQPIELSPVHPPKRLPAAPPRGVVMLSFSIVDPSLIPVPVRPPQAPGPPLTFRQEEVIIPRGNTGTIKVKNASGGKLIRTQDLQFHGKGLNNNQVAKIFGAQVSTARRDELEISADEVLAKYEAINCGETFFQVIVNSPTPPQKMSDILRLLSLADKRLPLALPPGDFSPDPRFSSGLMSKAGTPINPLPGLKINIFGEGESAGFDDYSTSIDFCTHTFSNSNGPKDAIMGHRPWTKDPRRPPGIVDKSVANICCRGSPISQETIDEILRIGASKCRVTYAESQANTQTPRIRGGLTAAGAKVIEEADAMGGPKGPGRGIILELA
jgi:hypothetical protein